ncbi:MAG: hypothetical protein ACTSX8_05155, partial [Alphaproteobacteria bacterium]
NVWKHPFVTHYDAAYFLDFARKLGGRNTVVSLTLAALFFIGLALSLRARWEFFALSVLWFAIPALILAVSSVRWFFPHRYLIFYHPVYVVLAAFGLIRAADAIAWLLTRWRKGVAPARLSRGIAAATMLFAAVCYLRENISYYRQEKQDWRGAARYLENTVPSRGVVVTGHLWTEAGLLQYWRGPRDPARLVTLCFDVERFKRVLIENANVWYVNWGALPKPVEQIVTSHLKKEKVFPGILGDIEIYAKRSESSLLLR